MKCLQNIFFCLFESRDQPETAAAAQPMARVFDGAIFLNAVGFIVAFKILTIYINHLLWLYITKCGPSYLKG